MGKGRYLGHAMRSKITPPAGSRWAPKPNARARCMGKELRGGGGGVASFMKASATCKDKGN